ncbi:MAG: glycosyltransferase family 4 protein, partial [Myxococcales bacterium]|nr:glycosyltransferase family 4 protein [Myxococcales bacterium]
MAPNPVTVNYLAPGLFDMGGIARYGRYQVRALREVVGRDRVRVQSLLAPEAGGFDDPFEVDLVGGGLKLRHKVKFAGAALLRSPRQRIHWTGHLHFAALALACAKAARGQAVVNIYGLEVWSSPPRSSVFALGRSWVVSDCHATLDEAISQGMVEPSRATVIWDPVDIAAFRPGPPDAAVAERYGLTVDDRFRVMFLGRLAPGARHKNPDGLIRAFARARLPANAELVIAGSGARSGELEALAHSLGIRDRVKFVGRVPDADLPAMYRLASVFALVSRRYHGGGEGIPLTPLEAAASGVPILVGDEDGSREAPVDGETGFILPSRDDAALEAALERLAGDRALVRRLGTAARERIEAHFSFERFVREHAAFIERINASTA